MALYQKFMSRAEDVADTFLRRSRHYLPHIARLFLIATYLDDGLRMWFQWDGQREYFDSIWSCGSVLATLFVLANMLCQIVGCFMVLLRKQVRVAVGMLFSVIVMQVSYILKCNYDMQNGFFGACMHFNSTRSAGNLINSSAACGMITEALP